MRYLYAPLTTAIAVVSLGVLARSGIEGPASAGAPQHLPVSTPTTFAVPETVSTLAQVQVPYTKEPEQAVSRAQAVEGGRAAAGLMGEDAPELVDATLMPLGEAMSRLGEGDQTETGLPDDALVWVVRMRGRFMPSSAPGPEQMVAKEGWAYTLLNANTGQMIGHGYYTSDTPLK